MININDILKDFPFIVLDGGLATELEKRGYVLNDHLWSAALLADNPAALRDVHLSFLQAGADCIITASYQATVSGFMKKGYSEKKSKELIKLSVGIARDAIKIFLDSDPCDGRPRPFIAGSAGCYGSYLADGSEYRGDYHLEFHEYADFHRERIELLAEAGADLIAFETLPCAEEGRAIIELMKDYPALPYWIVFSVKDDVHISNGDNFADFIRNSGSPENLIGCGINCSDPGNVTAILRSLQDFKKNNFVVYPNSGEVYNKSCNCWIEPGNRDLFLASVKEWYNLGATIIGGCCRTGPEDIKFISDFRKSLLTDTPCRC